MGQLRPNKLALGVCCDRLTHVYHVFFISEALQMAQAQTKKLIQHNDAVFEAMNPLKWAAVILLPKSMITSRKQYPLVYESILIFIW
jgi:hypothetical protein